MKQKKIEIKGISRMLPQSLSDDGLTRDILNMRPYNGALRPVGSDSVFQTVGVSSGKDHYIHHTTDGNEYIITSNGSAIVFTKVDGISTLLIYGEGDKSYRFSSLGNILVIFNETDEKMQYALYEIDTEAYRYIGEERFPEVLNISFNNTLTFNHEIHFTATGDADTDLATITGNFAKLEAQANTLGVSSGDVLFMYAYEMFDGTIIKHSHPSFVRGGIWYWKYDIPDEIYTKLTASTLRAVINTYDADLDSIRLKYGSLIKSINIYMTRPISRYLLLDITNCIATTSYVEVDSKSDLNVYESVISASSFRLVKKISLEELEENAVHDLSPVDITGIETLQPLPVDNFTHHKLYSKNDFLYNSRLWLGDMKTKLYKGYSPELFVGYPSPVYNNATYNIIFAVTIKDIDGQRLVYSDPFEYTYTDSGTNPKFTLNTFFSYPDTRAVTLKIIVQTGYIFYTVGEYNLTSHPLQNFSYVIFDNVTISGPFLYAAASLDAVSNIILDPNRLQASYTSNALYFPAINSYNVGSGVIKGMGANTLNIETGQFGDYPLYCFTTDGIWALSISRDPSILIDSIKPASMEVCTNSKAILPTSYGVIFITAKGVMLMSGMNAVRLDKVFEGDYQSPLKNSIEYQEILSDASIADTQNYKELVTYETFLQSARMGYNHLKEEIVIANPSYAFSYVYSFNSKGWFRVSKKYESFCNYYPKMLGLRTIDTNAALYDITVEDWGSVLTVPVLIETYPVKLEIDMLKKINALACRGTMNSDIEKGCGLYLFGSVDSVKWLNMSLLERSGIFVDMILGRASYSAYQFIIVFSGTVNQDSYLSHLDIAYEPKFNNKIR
jgi:hypothetical protein